MNNGEADGLTSMTGATRAGQPLGFSRLPSPLLRPWVARLGVTRVDLPPGEHLTGSMMSESAGLRVLFGSHWTGWTADGERIFRPGVSGTSLLFGSNSRAMRIRVEGSFAVATINLTAGALAAAGGPPPASLIDRIVDYDELVGHGRLSTRLRPEGEPEEWIAAIEQELLSFIARRHPPPPDPLITAFEQATLGDPTFAINDFARDHGVSQRTLERVVRRGMGVTPGFALRRARALDMAAVLLGVALAEEEPELRLRYFDQSHLIREMRHFFDLLPRQFLEDAHPLLRISVEIRQARRVALLDRVARGEINPWRDPAAEPRARRPAPARLSRTAS